MLIILLLLLFKRRHLMDTIDPKTWKMTNCFYLCGTWLIEKFTRLRLTRFQVVNSRLCLQSTFSVFSTFKLCEYIKQAHIRQWDKIQGLVKLVTLPFLLLTSKAYNRDTFPFFFYKGDKMTTGLHFLYILTPLSLCICSLSHVSHCCAGEYWEPFCHGDAHV